MAVNYVKGQILSSVLERDGIDIAIANANVGINTTSPRAALDVNGNILANNISANTANITGNVVVGNISTVGNVDAGNITGGNLTIANTVIAAMFANSTITLQPTGTGLVTISTNTGLVIPVGSTIQRPGPGIQGTIRFNTDSNCVEVYDGTKWDTFVPLVTNQILNGDSSTTSFTLNRSTTTAAVLIMLNGITQVPGQSYDMVPNPSTNLVFTEAPSLGDVIDIRFL
jgi:hypothetical protein